jgi:hypothetical protein
VGRPYIDLRGRGRIGAWFGVGILVLILSGLGIADAEIPRSSRPDDAQVYFISPADGEVLSSPFVVRFGLRGMGVAPAGVEKAGTGHHHLVVDAELPPSGLPIPATDHYRHFGKGQTEVTLDLPPGDHTGNLA